MMVDSRDSQYPVEVCGKCLLPIADNESGVRHYGLYRAHQEHRCIDLLHGEIGRLRKRLESYEKADRDMNEALNSGDGSYRP